MIIYVKYDTVTDKVLKSLTQVDPTWTEISLSSISDTVIYDPTTSTFSVLTAKDKLIKTLEKNIYKATEKFIYSEYPKQKQNSDVADKELFTRWLNDVRIDLTRDDIEALIYKDAYDILFGLRTYEEVIALYPTTEYKYFDTLLPESVAWIQLLKVSLRVSWVQQIKLYSHSTVNSLQSLTIDQLKSFDISSIISSFPSLPDYLK